MADDRLYIWKIRIWHGRNNLYETKNVVKVESIQHVKHVMRLGLVFNILILVNGASRCQSFIFSMNKFSVWKRMPHEGCYLQHWDTHKN